MTSDEMEHGTKPSKITNENSIEEIERNHKFDVLKDNNLSCSSISTTDMNKSMENTKPSIILQTIDSRSIVKNQEIFNSSSSTPYNNIPIYRPVLSIPEAPLPKIPIQFQLTAAKLNYIKSQKSVAFDTKKIDSFPTVVTSGTNSTTVNHTNRSLVYSESVSTKGTAPTKNTIGINTSDFVTNSLNNPKDSIYSTGIDIARNSSAKISGFKVLSPHSLLLPATQSSRNASMNSTGTKLSHTNQTLLEQSSDGSVLNLETNIHRNLQSDYSLQVNT